MANNRAITEVRGDSRTQGAGTASSVLTLGLAISELARIVGVSFSLSYASAPIAAAGQVIAAVSFDPEDTAINLADNEQFAVAILQGTIGVADGGLKQSENFYLDFSNLNMLTSRNLRFLSSTLVAAATTAVRVFFERTTPTNTELNQIIARRR